MFRPTSSKFLATIIMAMMTIALTAQTFGQTDPPTIAPPHPHDFSDKYYLNNGVNPKDVTKRLTGDDFLSTITETNDPMFSNIRVLITLPAYDQNGQPIFWSPLGLLPDTDPNSDTGGVADLAARYPIYVFPTNSVTNSSQFFSGTRQSVLMDNNAEAELSNPLGVRQVFMVNYTPNADTPWGSDFLEAMAKVNGTALDGWPIVKTVEELKTLVMYDLVTITSNEHGSRFAICPIIQDHQNGAIAKDAFLSITTTEKGDPLDGERIFVSMFECAQDESQCSMK